ncbi:adenosylcobinamide-phosphate synthase CbiB [Phenylobacterium koreense]|uniref:Cobalamin biosynthesis protein CobD n=1 Tax=Phenylobacterium koreense TaxID=266125 RepID=A0ABV2EGF3_9CAUL
MPADPWIVLAAAGLEGAVGYPARLPHPVTWVGGALGLLDRWFNRGGDLARRLTGAVTLVIVAGGAALTGHAVARLDWAPLTILAGATGLAARSLYDHVAAVARAPDLASARAAVAMIVGRDVDRLDEAGVAAAALESLAESFNDGVVAPLFWFLLAGLPGLFAYKAVNTADSMIGHKEEPYRCFGWAAARSDDLMNLVPARLAGLLIVLAAGRGGKTMAQDARGHASPNSGWPEAAMAGALGVQLGGPAYYDGVEHARPSFGDGRRPTTADLKRGLGIYLRACAVLAVLLALGGLAWPR